MATTEIIMATAEMGTDSRDPAGREGLRDRKARLANQRRKD